MIPHTLFQKFRTVFTQFFSCKILFQRYQGSYLIQPVCTVRIGRKYIGQRFRSNHAVRRGVQHFLQLITGAVSFRIDYYPLIHSDRIVELLNQFVKLHLYHCIIRMPERNHHRRLRIRHFFSSFTASAETDHRHQDERCYYRIFTYPSHTYSNQCTLVYSTI